MTILDTISTQRSGLATIGELRLVVLTALDIPAAGDAYTASSDQSAEASAPADETAISSAADGQCAQSDASNATILIHSLPGGDAQRVAGQPDNSLFVEE